MREDLPQIIMAVWMAASVLSAVDRQGRMERVNAGDRLGGIALLAALLWWGGFWG